MYQYRATVNRWIDGDTVEMTVDLGFHMTTVQRFRLLDVDTPERGPPNYVEARKCSEYVLPPGADLEIESVKTEKYGRWLVALPDVVAALTKNGLLKPQSENQK